MPRPDWSFALVAGLVAALVAALAPGGGAELQQASSAAAAWPRVSPDLELSFPADHGAHPEFKTEWWYVTGNVEAADGRRFGFQFTIFRNRTSPELPAAGESPLRARQVLAGHLAVTDVGAGRTLFAERLRRTGTPWARCSETDLELVLEDWAFARRDGADGERLHLAAGDAAVGLGLELELVPRKPLVLHGERGYSAKGGELGNASAYTSWTRLETTGRLEVGGEIVDVRGEAWFDHEYGSSLLADGVVGWDWFGLQLEDGRELMLFRLRGADGSRAPAAAGTWTLADGTTRTLGPRDFEIETRESWTSPHTGAVYPARWTMRIHSEELVLDVRPLVRDAELLTRRSTGVAYWEGPVEVSGDVVGRGYGELTGYAGSMRGKL